MAQSDHPIPPEMRRARGATRSDSGRFERLTRHADPEIWEEERDFSVIRTHVRTEQVKSAINYVRSPDLPFDRSINPYRGCEHGCIYCFARPSHAYLGLSPGLDFETNLIARPNMAEILARELRSKTYRPATMAIGTNTDPYQPIERGHGIMRECLDVLDAFNHPVAIVTKGTLIERDIDILSRMAQRGLARVGVSVTTLDADLSRKMEPRVPVPARRLETIKRLSEAGIDVRIMMSPVVPGLTDHEMESVLAAGHRAGAKAASWIMLRLPREVASLWQDWLVEHYPYRAQKILSKLRDMHGGELYSARWNHRMRGEGVFAKLVAQRFNRAARQYGLDGPLPKLRTDLFEPPPQPGDQLTLL